MNDPNRTATELQLRWWERSWFVRVLGLAWLALGVSMLPQVNQRASVGALIASFVLGVAFGILIWLFDSWWSRHESVRTVRAKGGEFARRAPTIAVFIGGALLATWWVVNDADGTGLVFVFTTIAMLNFLVAPGLERRRAERRAIQAVPVRPDVSA